MAKPDLIVQLEEGKDPWMPDAQELDEEASGFRWGKPANQHPKYMYSYPFSEMYSNNCYVINIHISVLFSPCVL